MPILPRFRLPLLRVAVLTYLHLNILLPTKLTLPTALVSIGMSSVAAGMLAFLTFRLSSLCA